MQTFHVFPDARLSPYIDRFWGWESEQGEAIALPTLLPGTGAELYFHYRTPFRSVAANGAQCLCDDAHLLCLRRAPLDLCEADDVGFIAVRFRAGMLGRFTDVPGGELMDRPHSIEDLWGARGRMLVSRVGGAGSLSERLRLVQAFLSQELRDDSPDEIVERAVSLLYRQGAGLSIERLASEFGLGRRQLERRFQALVGQPPSEVRRLVRFQKTVRMLTLYPLAGSVDAALAHGYYDQAHFIRDFRQLVLDSPRRYLARARARTHFYNHPRGA